MYRRFSPFLLAAVAVIVVACGQGSSKSRVPQGDKLLAQGKLAEAILEYRATVLSDPKNGEARLKLGRALVKTGDTTRAVDQLVRAADLLPDDESVQVDATKALLFVGRFDDAKGRAERLLQRNPKSVIAHVLRAGATANMKDPEDAITSMKDALELEPNRAATRVDLATLQASQGQTAEAEAGFKQAITTDPKSVQAHLALGNFYWAAGRRADSEKSVLNAIAADPKSVGANLILARLYLSTGRPALAEEPLKRIVSGSREPEHRLNLADYYIAQSRPADARPILEELSKEKASAAAARARLAGVEYQNERKPEAHKLIDALIAEQPENAEVRVVKGRWQLREGNVGGALVSAQAAVKADQKSAPALSLLGAAYSAQNKIDDAMKAYSSALQLNPGDIDVQVALANLNVARGRNDAAVDMARQAANNAPGNGAAKYALARALFSQGRQDDALVELSPVIQAAPNSPEVLTLLGRIQQKKGDKAAAKRSLSKALESKPLSLEALTALTNLDFSEKRREEATRRVEGFVAKAPNDAGLLVIAARTYAANGDLAKAEASLRKAIDKDPSRLEAYHGLGQLFVRQNRLDDARRAYEQRLAQQPNDIGALTMLGMILYTQGKPTEARVQFERVLGVEPKAPVALNNLAYLDAEAGTNLEVALDRAQTVKSLLPDDADVNDTLGWIYVKRGLPALAVSPLEQATKKAPESPLYQFHLGMAYAKAGDPYRARPALERALQLAPNFPGADEAKRTLASLGR